MLDCVTGGGDCISFDLYTSDGHGIAIMIPEVKRQPLREVDRKNSGVLPLMVELLFYWGREESVPCLLIMVTNKCAPPICRSVKYSIGLS